MVVKQTAEITQYAEKAGLPASENLVAGILDDRLFVGYYAMYLKKYGVVFKDIRKAYEENKEEIKNFLERIHYDKTLQVDENTAGFYIRVPPRTNVPIPIYGCFIIGTRGITQRIINIIDIGDNSNVLIAKGCASLVSEGAHSAMTLLYVGKNSMLKNLMIHNWAPNIDVGSKTYGLMDENSKFEYYYVKISPIRALGLSSHLVGMKNSTIEVHEASVAHKNSRLNTNTLIELRGNGSRAVITSRGVVEENGYMNVMAKIIAEADETKGHIECNGLVLGKGIYKTAPVLETKTNNTRLTHEASIGKISGEQIFYLQTRGLSEEEATKMIILGFLSSALIGLPEKMREYVQLALKQITSFGKGF